MKLITIMFIVLALAVPFHAHSQSTVTVISLPVPSKYVQFKYITWNPQADKIAGIFERLDFGNPHVFHVAIWNSRNGELLQFLGDNTPKQNLTWSPDGQFLATVDFGYRMKIWEVSTGQVIASIDLIEQNRINRVFANGFGGIAWHPTDHKIALFEDWYLHIWNFETGELKSVDTSDLAITSYDGTNYRSARSGTYDGVWSCDGKNLFVATAIGDILIIDSATLEKKSIFFSPMNLESRRWGGLWSDLYIPNPDNFVSLSSDCKHLAFFYNTYLGDTRTLLSKFFIHDLAMQTGIHINQDFGDHQIYAVAWRPDSSQVAIAYDNMVQIQDVSIQKEIYTLTGHTDRVISLTWRPDGTQLATVSDDNTLRIWDVPN